MKITTTSKLDRLGWFFPEIITVCGIDHRKFIKIKINQIKRVFLLLFFCEKKPLVIQAMFYFLYFLFYCVYMQFWILSLKKKKFHVEVEYFHEWLRCSSEHFFSFLIMIFMHKQKKLYKNFLYTTTICYLMDKFFCSNDKRLSLIFFSSRTNHLL